MAYRTLCLPLPSIRTWPGLLFLTAGLLGLALAQPAALPAARGAAAPGALLLSDQARRFLALQRRSFQTEFMGCMIGGVRAGRVLVDRIAPADVEPRHSTTTWVLPKQTCEAAGWTGTVGTIHSHVTAERCWYYFPGTAVPNSDGQSFTHSPYPVDAILCGDTVVWISRDLVEKRVPLNSAGATR